MAVCPTCGLPLQACICKELTKEKQHIKIEKSKRKFGKIVTVITGIENPKEIARQLKEQLACGGTVKENTIELQGDHSKRVKEKLISMGFSGENIEQI